MRRVSSILSVAIALALTANLTGDEPSKDPVQLKLGQKEFLSLEPILVTVRADQNLPATPGDKETLRFDIKPAVKPRSGAKPLPVEAKTKDAKVRIYDLLEWYQFPAEGSFTISAVVSGKEGSQHSTTPVSITISRPDKKETNPVARLHHLPWSNYVTDAFCGDTFNLVKQWPDSKLVKYCHYWNGLHHQHKKQPEKAIESFQMLLKQFPDFILAEHARVGIVECKKAALEAKGQ